MVKTKFFKLVSVMVGVLMVAGLVAGCGGQKEDVIKFGANLEMTGNNATFGQSATNGAKLAIKEVNAKGGVLGKQLTLVVADNKSEAAEAANAMQKLLTQDKVVAVIAPIASSSVIAAAQVNADNKVLAISPTASNPKVTVDPNTGKVREFNFRAAFIDPFQGSVMATFAQNSLKAKTAALYIDNSSDYAKGLGQFFKETFEKNGGKIVASEAYLAKDTDFKATLTKIKAQNPDVVFVPGYYQEVGMIIKQARELGLTVPFLGGDGWDSAKLPEIGGAQALNNTFFSNHYSPDDNSPAVQTFVEAYKKEYNQTPDAFAALSYDATMMVIEAMKRSNSADPVKIKDELAKTKDYQAVSGLISFDANHDPIKSAVIIEMKDGNKTFKEKVNP
ncbi:Leucine-specific-binding protein [Sporomusa paucivorans]|jgi:branched-chain amino acid transport system substrate-binding protein|uniref:Leucine-specific-binding protein n=3 Tax=Sporomusaceae TaxID=1843490 RepID=A0ABP2C4C3_9FIRM|nr:MULTISPECIES: ABC transporter substrate-binding protein [Sporomusa]MCM0759374.1 ABC transporter substrate-binding protein [Sporomusa sphaeroides DSM 2875]OLS56461.1 leucine-specific-binding protein precursor [Sporomusa sphaeroides DSM 2875]CVK18556.1 Leucine-specific-binding protein precursor [Sporomusa sphaeroides DSM 2875]SCM82284.1 Branched-chain amino binding protein [uncultured Sporomusa sp.]HML35529.1 ABC transporter substrate-binding protein [Sporomusa sphaeroides]